MMSERQMVVLRRFDWDYGSESWPYLSTVAKELEMTHGDVRNAARARARKGFVRVQLLFDDNGYTAGSTYIITEAGHLALEEKVADA